MLNRLFFIVIALFFTAAANGQYLVPDLDASQLEGPRSDYTNVSGIVIADLEILLDDPGADTDGDSVTDLVEFLVGSDKNVADADHVDKFNLALALAGDLDGSYTGFDAKLTQVFGGSPTVPPYLSGLSPTLETQFSSELRGLARDLDYDPVRIYEWVYANIEYENYVYSRKGALATLRTGRGNEWDQCSLLIALLRISGVPARYVVADEDYLSRTVLNVASPNDEIRKELVAVQAWVNASRYGNDGSTRLDAPHRNWITLAPWHKTTEIVSLGTDLFPLLGDNSLEIPEELDIRKGDFALHWEFEDSLVDSAGFYDADPNNSSTISYVDGAIGRAIDLSSVNVLLQADYTSDINARDVIQRTVSLWFEPNSTTGTNKQVLFDEGGGSRGLNAYLVGRTLYVGWWTNDGGGHETWLVASDTIDAGTTYHLSVVLDGEGASKSTPEPGRLQAYLNGSSASFTGTGTATWLGSHNALVVGGVTNGSRFQDGSTVNSNDHYYSGWIDDLRVYNTALTPSQLNRLYSKKEPFDPEDDSRIRQYLRPAADVDNDLAAFNRHTQQTSIEYFEQAIQSYLADNYPGLSLKDLPVQEQIDFQPAGALPATTPHTLAFSAAVVQPAVADTIAADVGELSNKRATADLEFEKSGASTPFLSANNILLPQVSTRRLVFDQVNTAAAPVLLIDGVSLVTGTDELGPSDKFHFSYRWPLRDWAQRPDIDAGAFININLDPLAVSQSTVQDIKTELIDSSITDVNDAFSSNIQERESFLGRYSDILSETWVERANQAMLRRDHLMRLEPQHDDVGRTFAFIWTYPNKSDFFGSNPDEILNEDAPFGFHPQWRIDASITSGGLYKWSGTESLSAFVTESLLFAYRVAGDVSSYNEAAVFEDWQGTPGLSTIEGFFAARLQGIEIDISEVPEGTGTKTTTAPVTDVMILDPENPDPNNPIFQSSVSLEETIDPSQGKLSVGWFFGNFDGGSSIKTPDYGAIKQNASFNFSLPDISLSGNNSNSAIYPTVSNNSYVKNFSTYRNPVPIGDPIDPVSGEFYLDEPADLSIRSLGFSLEVSRYYGNQMIYDGPFGYGWAWSHSDGLLFETEDSTGNRVAIVYYDGRRRALRIEDDGSTLTPPPGSTFEIDELATPEAVSTDDSRLVRFEINFFNGLTIRFDTDGRLLQKRDANGNTLTFHYDSTNQRIVRFEDSIGRAIAFDYNPQGKIIRATDYADRSVTYEYDDSDLIAFTDLEGNTYRYEYLKDQTDNPLLDHNLSKQILPDGEALELFYYINDTVSHHTNSLGETFHFQYSPLNRYAETWNEKGFYRKLYWDTMGNVIRVDARDRAIETRVFDDNHNMIAQIDGNGYRTTFQYDDQRNLISSTNELGESQVFEYENISVDGRTISRLKRQITPDGDLDISGPDPFYEGVVTEFEYADTAHPMLPTKQITAKEKVKVKVDTYDHNIPVFSSGTPALVGVATDLTGAIEHATDFEYDPRGNLVKQTDTIAAAGQSAQVAVTEHVFDIHGLNMVQSIQQPGAVGLERITYFAYDDLGRVVATTDAEGHTAQMTLNGYGQPLRVTDPSGAVTVNHYDVNRRLSQTVNPNGGVSSLSYITPFFGRNFDRVASETDALGFAVTHRYDEVGNRVSTTDRNGNTTRFKYDQMHRLVETINAIGQVTRTRYDGAGNAVANSFFIDGIEHTIRMDYDAAGRLVLRRESWDDRRATRLTYDATGNLTGEERGFIDSAGVNLEPAVAMAAFSALDSTDHEYDERNRRVRTTRTDAASGQTRTTELVYDSLGRVLETVELNGGDSQNPGLGSRRTRMVYDVLGNVTDEYLDEYDAGWQMRRHLVHEYDGRNLRIATTLKDRARMAANGTAGTDDITERFVYDASGRLIAQYQDPLLAQLQGTRHHYDDASNLVRVEQYAGGLWSDGSQTFSGATLTGFRELTYTLRNEPATTTDALGGSETFRYDRNGNAIERVDEDGFVTQTWYDALDRPVAEQDALGHLRHLEYDDRGRLAATITPLGDRTRLIYNANDELIEQADPLGNTTTFAYDKRGRQIETRDPRHNAGEHTTFTTTTYNDFDEVVGVSTPVTLGSPMDALVAVTNEYDALGRVIKVTDARGFDTVTAYDVFDRPVETIEAFDAVSPRPEQTTTRWVYDQSGNVLEEVRAHGEPEASTTRFAYDELNRSIETTIVNPAGGGLTSSTAYNDAARTMTATDAFGQTVVTAFDLLGRAVSVTDEAGDQTTFAYDRRGNRVQTTPPTGSPDVPTRTTYDALGRVVSVERNGDTRTTAYDAAGRVVREVDALGTITLSTYDAADRRLRVTEAAGTADEAITKFAYDPNGNLTAVVDANHASGFDPAVTEPDTDKAMRYAYDDLDRRISETDPDGNARTLRLDAHGNAAQTTLRDGTVVVRQFDALDRLTRVTASGFLEQQFAYDPLGRLTKAFDYNQNRSTRIVGFRYDFAQRVTAEHADERGSRNTLGNLDTLFANWDQASPPASTLTVATAYDDAPGSVGVSRREDKTYPSGRVIRTDFDPRNRVKTVADISGGAPGTQLADYGYDERGRVSTLALGPSGSSVADLTVTYDPRGRETLREYVQGLTSLYKQDTGHDARSNVTAEVVTGSATVTDFDYQYAHDALHRLTQRDDQSVNNVDIAWDYDKVGNWTSTTQNLPGGEAFTADAENQIASVTPSGGGARQPRYDPRGSLLFTDAAGASILGTLQALYDWDNRLWLLRPYNGTYFDDNLGTRPHYDALGRRVKTLAGGVWTQLIHDGQRVVEQRDGQDLATATPTHSFAYGDYVDEPVAMIDESVASGGTTHFYLHDRRYSVVALLDSSGAVAESYAYNAFGKTTIYDDTGAVIASSALDNPHAFTGRRYHPATASYDYRARVYLPELGRFLQRDPAGYIDGYHLYTYVGNNPLAFIDPSGLGRQQTDRAWHAYSPDVQSLFAGAVQGDPWATSQLSPLGLSKAQELANDLARQQGYMPVQDPSRDYIWGGFGFNHVKVQDVQIGAFNVRAVPIAEPINHGYRRFNFNGRGETLYSISHTYERARQRLQYWNNQLNDLQAARDSYAPGPIYGGPSPDAIAYAQAKVEYFRSANYQIGNQYQDMQNSLANANVALLGMGSGTAEGAIPIWGEYQDARVIFGRDSTFGQRSVATGSFALNVFTGTLAPNFGKAYRAANEIPAATTNAAINPRLTQRLQAFRSYQAQGGAKSMRDWVKSTQGNSAYGAGFDSGYRSWIRGIEGVHGNSASSLVPASLYRLSDLDGSLLKWGVTQNLSTRYPRSYLADKQISEVANGLRFDMLRLERNLVETQPGPLNLEPWAGVASP